MQLQKVDFKDYEKDRRYRLGIIFRKIANAYITFMEKAYPIAPETPSDFYNFFKKLLYMAKDTEYGQYGQIHYDQFVEIIQRMHIALTRHQFEMADLNHD